MAQAASTWDGSTFDPPFAFGTANAMVDAFPFSGVFVNHRAPIREVDIQFGRGTADRFDPADGDACVPEDLGPVADTAATDPPSADADPTTYEFDVAADAVRWPCNGRFTIRATATAVDAPPTDADPTGGGDPTGDAVHVLDAVVTVAVAPPPVRSVDATVDDGANTVTVAWAALGDDQLAADALGYQVERAGPRQSDGSGDFVPVGRRVGVHDETRFVDHVAVAGDYRYRVRALRNGADGPVPSPADETPVAHAAMQPDPTTTATTAHKPARSGVSQRSTTTRRSSPPTTADTGFEGTLDYGDQPVVGTSADRDTSELAGGEGQAVIHTESGGHGVGLLAPVAGALVLVGWAGHLTYLNRLAKQL